MTIFAIWFVACILVGVVAGSWNRSGFLWWLLAFLISPILAWLILLCAGKRQPTRVERHRTDPLAAMTQLGLPSKAELIAAADAQEAARKATYGKSYFGFLAGLALIGLVLGIVASA
jgi:hypothetical protein